MIRRPPTVGASALGILAYARAGATDTAWALFLSSGLAEQGDDPSAATLRGRLLKDRAARTTGESAKKLLREAAAAYQHAADLTAATYPRINAATLSLLGGDAESSRRAAAQVLAQIEEHPDEPETPYFRAATRAEALLLLDRREEARDALVEAVAVAPRAWEDHATTLRQFDLILSAKGQDAAWLALLRPPRSLHFGGHMSFDPAVARRDRLDGAIASVLDEEQVMFGYGALGAGADIIVAEALIERGAELHVILPAGVDAFAAVSVDPFGAAWRGRFEALVEQATTLRTIAPRGEEPGEALIGLASEIAMGAAAMNASRLHSEAVQLLIVDPKEPSLAADSATARARDIWAVSGCRQRLVEAPREAVSGPEGSPAHADGSHALAVLAIVPVSAGSDRPLPVQERLMALRDALDAEVTPLVAPYWDGGSVLLAYGYLKDAARIALALTGEGHRVGGHYAAATPFRDPFSGTERLPPTASEAAVAACASTPAASAYVTEDFAAALFARESGRATSEFVGELEAADAGPPVGLFVLR